MKMRRFRMGCFAAFALLLVCGAVQTAFAGVTYDSTFVSTGVSLPQGLWVSSAGHVYVVNANTGANSKIMHFDASGTLLTTRVISGARPRAIAVNPNNGHVYTVGSGNLLDFADFDNSPDYTILANSLGTYSSVFTVQGMAFNADYSKLYVGNTGGSNIKVYNTSDWSLSSTISLPSGSKIPGAGPMAFDSQGNLYVADYSSTNVANVVGNGRLLKYNTNSATWSTFVSGLRDSLNGNAADSPSAVAIDASDNVYITLRGSRAGGDGAIYKYTSNGTLLSTFRTISTAELMNLPQGGLAFDASYKHLYVSSTNGNKIQRYVLPIDAPGNLSATEGATSVALTWTNTTDPNFDSVTIRRSSSDYPATATDGTAVASGLTGTSYADDTTSLGTATRFYYSLFTKDASGNYSDPARVSVIVNRGTCSMQAYWKFDGSVSTPVDSTGNGYDGTSTGSVSLSESVPTTGFVDPYSFSFNGIDGAVTVSRPVQDDFSMCAWINTTAAGAGSNHWETTAIAHAEAANVANDFGFGMNAAGILAFGDGDGGSDYTVTGVTAVNTGNWVHACATRVKSSGSIRLYVNGVLDASGSGSTTSLTDNTSMTIGNGTDGGQHWNGLLDDVRVYAYALTSAEVADLADGVDACFGAASPRATASSSSSSSQAYVQHSGGGHRGSPGRGGTAPVLGAESRTASSQGSSSSSAAPALPVAPVSPMQQRICGRVTKWFHGNAPVLERLNKRLEKSFGFTCGG